jgi:pimeloyl-ACP methyl ester carboxylesterase
MTTALYIHGLESGPRGRKARYLAAAGFHVVSVQMPCGRARIARDPVVLATAASAAAVVVGATARWGVLGLALSASAAGAAMPFALSRVMRRVWRRSLDAQLEALAANRIDVIVGSSFGGAIALALLTRGAWDGPTVLLCPAQQLVARRARLPAPSTLAALPASLSSRVVVVHGSHDETVPLSDSRTLVEGSQARLIVVDDDHRLSATATPEHLAEWIGKS